MRLIDADALSQHFKHMWWPTGESYKGVLIDDIYNAPTIDAAPVVRGKWKVASEYYDKAEIECSNCGDTIDTYYYRKKTIKPFLYDYCPNCGACMKEV